MERELRESWDMFDVEGVGIITSTFTTCQLTIRLWNAFISIHERNPRLSPAATIDTIVSQLATDDQQLALHPLTFETYAVWFATVLDEHYLFNPQTEAEDPRLCEDDEEDSLDFGPLDVRTMYHWRSTEPNQASVTQGTEDAPVHTAAAAAATLEKARKSVQEQFPRAAAAAASELKPAGESTPERELTAVTQELEAALCNAEAFLSPVHITASPVASPASVVEFSEASLSQLGGESSWWAGNPLDRSARERKDAGFESRAQQEGCSLYLAVSSQGILTTTTAANHRQGKGETGSEWNQQGRSQPGEEDAAPEPWYRRRYRKSQRAGGRELRWLPLSALEAAGCGGERFLLGASTSDETGATTWHWGVLVEPSPSFHVAAGMIPAATVGVGVNSALQCMETAWTTGRAFLDGVSGVSGRGSSSAGLSFAREEVAIAGQALALAQWHRATAFSSKTGTRTVSIECGAKRQGEGSGGGRLYPRIDPCAIVLVLSPTGSHCLLGRSTRFAKLNREGFFSCLAGFLEQGEAVEEAARREVREEAGVELSNVRLVASQPWPIGRAGSCEVMLGCIATAQAAAGETTTTTGGLPLARPVDGELAEVRWFSKEEARAMLERGRQGVSDGTKEEPAVPGEYAIAHRLIEAWARPQGRATSSSPANSSAQAAGPNVAVIADVEQPTTTGSGTATATAAPAARGPGPFLQGAALGAAVGALLTLWAALRWRRG